MTEPEAKGKKRKFWEVDPSIFKPGPKDSWQRRYLIEPARSLAKFTFLGLLLAYPLVMVTLGIVFGGAYFWGIFAGSLGLIGFVIWKAGYARNLENWNPNFRRQLVGLTFGFLLTAGFWLVLTTFLEHLEFALWIGAVIAALIVIAVGVTMRRARE